MRRSHSSVGRAPALQAGGHWFEPNCDHHSFGGVAQLVRVLACHARCREFESLAFRHIKYYAQIAQSVEQGTENPRVGGSIPPLGTTFKDGRIAQLGEHLPYKQGVIG